jgi:hypothetical protein
VTAPERKPATVRIAIAMSMFAVLATAGVVSVGTTTDGVTAGAEPSDDASALLLRGEFLGLTLENAWLGDEDLEQRRRNDRRIRQVLRRLNDARA